LIPSFGFRVSGFRVFGLRDRVSAYPRYALPRAPFRSSSASSVRSPGWCGWSPPASDEDGGPDTGLFYVFGMLYVALRVMKQLFSEPMSVLPAFAILLGSGALIWLGIAML